MTDWLAPAVQTARGSRRAVKGITDALAACIASAWRSCGGTSAATGGGDGRTVGRDHCGQVRGAAHHSAGDAGRRRDWGCDAPRRAAAHAAPELGVLVGIRRHRRFCRRVDPEDRLPSGRHGGRNRSRSPRGVPCTIECAGRDRHGVCRPVLRGLLLAGLVRRLRVLAERRGRGGVRRVRLVHDQTCWWSGHTRPRWVHSCPPWSRCSFFRYESGIDIECCSLRSLPPRPKRSMRGSISRSASAIDRTAAVAVLGMRTAHAAAVGLLPSVVFENNPVTLARRTTADAAPQSAALVAGIDELVGAADALAGDGLVDGAPVPVAGGAQACLISRAWGPRAWRSVENVAHVARRAGRREHLAARPARRGAAGIARRAIAGRGVDVVAGPTALDRSGVLGRRGRAERTVAATIATAEGKCLMGDLWSSLVPLIVGSRSCRCRSSSRSCCCVRHWVGELPSRGSPA